MERNLDFDKIIDRRGTNCIKYDGAIASGLPADILPLWVADMDFRTSSYIQDAIKAQAEHGIWGYSDAGEGYFLAIEKWMQEQFGWQVRPEWLVKAPGIVFALAMAVKAFTKHGDTVLIQQPVYHPFRHVIVDNERIVADNSLIIEEDGTYRMDVDDFERQIVANNIKLFFLCNPHNPVGRVWSEAELIAIGDICYKHGVIVVSDEIHADFVFEGEHKIFANLKEEYRQMTITCTAPSKTFNTAGLQISNIFIENEELRGKFEKAIKSCGYGEPTSGGVAACEAAYKDGRQWYEAMKEYVKDNITFVEAYLKEQLPQVKMKRPEGTYLVWLDLRELGLSNEERRELIVKKAQLWLNEGEIFGEQGSGFERINVACPRAILHEALDRLRDAIMAWK